MEDRKPDRNWTQEEESRLFSNLEVPYSKSKEEVWQSIEHLSQNQQESPSSKLFSLHWKPISIAASIVFVVGLGLFARFYTTHIVVPAGQFATLDLPDGSIVHLNAASALSYTPWWWTLNRQVKLEGEAYFEVEEGETFTVQTPKGKVTVLGTEYNVYDREGAFEVFCSSGKVQAFDLQGNTEVLEPGDMVQLNENDQLIRVEKSEDEVLAWRLRKFIYNTTPLTKVFADVERHYDVQIRMQLAADKDYSYTGLFNRSTSAEEALEIICFSFDDLVFEKEGPVSFIVKSE